MKRKRTQSLKCPNIAKTHGEEVFEISLIKEQKTKKKEAEHKLLLKKKELEIMTRLDMKAVNKLLLTEDVRTFSPSIQQSSSSLVRNGEPT